MYDHINADTNNQRKVLHALILAGYDIGAAELREEIRARLGKAPAVSTIRKQINELSWQGLAERGRYRGSWVPVVAPIVASATNNGIRLTPAEVRALYHRDMAETKTLLELTVSVPRQVEAEGVPLMFGHSSAAPNDGRPVWGARFNIEGWGLDFPQTNQDHHRGDASQAELRAFILGVNRALPTMRRDGHELIQTGQLREDEVAELATGDRHLRCLARRAGGYVHVCAFRLDRELPDDLKWSGALPPPALGVAVQPNVCEFGKGTVVGYHEECECLAVRLLLSSAPDWYTRQNGGLVPAVVFGCDLTGYSTEDCHAAA